MSFGKGSALCGALLLTAVVQVLVPCELWGGNPDSSYRFETQPGQTNGAWPDVWTVERLAQLRTRYGFNFMAVPAVRASYDAALQAGYTPQSLKVHFSYGYGPHAVDSFPAAMYYVDEAVEHTCAGAPSAGPIHSPQELAALRDYIHQHRPGALFVSSGYKRCSHLRILGEYVDRIMYSSYVNWAELTTTYCRPNLGWGDSSEIAFIPIAYDQRPSWSSMKAIFGPKFTMTWIRGRDDDYDILLPHANALELSGLWLYHGEPIDTTLLLNFCTAAWRNGWMTRIADLPLSHLSSFSAVRIAGVGVRLQWATAGEREHLGYSVERRTETQGEFSVLPNSFVPRRGTPGEPQQYTFVDSTAPIGTLMYRLRAIDLDGTVRFSLPVTVAPATGVEENTPLRVQLFQNYPNPFSTKGGSATGGNPSTTVSFSIPSSSFVMLKMYDALGREVATLVEEELPAGSYKRLLNVENLASGVYLYRLSSGGYSQTRKLILIR